MKFPDQDTVILWLSAAVAGALLAVLLTGCVTVSFPLPSNLGTVHVGYVPPQTPTTEGYTK